MKPADLQPPGVAGLTWAVLAHELRVYLYSPLVYLVQIGFLLMLAVCVFLVAEFFTHDEASVRLLLVFAPWVAIVFVPALAMRAWVDGDGDRSYELSASLPTPRVATLLGKFLAGASVLQVTLLLTGAFPVSVAYLGDPDDGVVFATYLALALLLATCFAIALFGSALARDQAGAFVVSAGLLFVLLISGWSNTADWLPQTWSDVVSTYSPRMWLDVLGHGRLQLGAFAYFVLVSALALAATAIVLERRRHVARRIDKRWYLQFVALALAFVLLPPQLLHLHQSLDVTAEREFTLSEASVQLAERLPRGVRVNFYWSDSQPNIPQAIRAHARRVGELLRAFAAASNGSIALQRLDPEPDSETELMAIGDGVQRIPMSSGEYFYFGATVEHEGRRGRLAYFDLSRERLAEYDVAVLLQGLSHDRTARIGVLSPLLAPDTAQRDREGLSFLSALRSAYDVAVIPYFADALPDRLDVLILINPVVLRQGMLRAVDAYLMNGGSVLAMLDPFVRFDSASNQINPSPSQEINDLSDLLAVYGARFVPATVVGDASSAAPVDGMVAAGGSYPYWLSLRAPGLSRSHPATADLNELLFPEPGEFVVAHATRATVLAQGSELSARRERSDFERLSPPQLALDFVEGNGPAVIAAALHGPLTSAFDAQRQSADDALVFAVADIDWLFDAFSVQPVQSEDGQSILRPVNDNLAFLLNLIEYASGDASLIAIRSRGQVSRPFTRVEELLRTSGEEFTERERALAQTIESTERQIAAYLESTGTRDLSRLPETLRDQLLEVQRKLLPARRELREVRLAMRQSVQSLSRTITLINLISGPIAVVLLFGLVRILRRTILRPN
ncbi:MAG: ABC transporter permease subunit [Gammaproteobacteria bacterium]|nr:ABC transporter permease subunit [Gammaproteobacteria bacterium]